MARRPDYDPPRTREELDTLNDLLSMYSVEVLQKKYVTVLSEMKFGPLPSPRKVQEFVALWRLWKKRRR